MRTLILAVLLAQLLLANGLLLVASCVQTTPSSFVWCHAGLVQLNGHAYERITTTMNFTSAKTFAEARMYLGVRGHLATITSKTEQDFVAGIGVGWLGGQYNATRTAFVWTSGPDAGQSISYQAWGPSRPDNATGSEFCLQLWRATSTSTPAWDDDNCSSQRASIIEYDCPAGMQFGATACERKAGDYYFLLFFCFVDRSQMILHELNSGSFAW